jgi:hypothetical protein
VTRGARSRSSLYAIPKRVGALNWKTVVWTRSPLKGSAGRVAGSVQASAS